MFEIIGQAVLGICAGGFVAAGLFTLIVTLGIVTRLAQITHTADHIHFYENAVVLGAIVGTCFSCFPLVVTLRDVGGLLFGLFAGIFTGCLVGAVAEILNAFPIFFRRLRLHQGIALVVVVLAVGKFIGGLILHFG